VEAKSIKDALGKFDFGDDTDWTELAPIFCENKGLLAMWWTEGHEGYLVLHESVIGLAAKGGAG
jgi:hypothetical protein